MTNDQLTNRTQVSNDYYACGEGRARGGKRGAQAGRRGSTCGDEIRAYYATCYPERCTRTRSHLAGAALLHRRRHGDDTASPMASPWACPARRPTLRSIRRPTVRPARRRPTVAPETASDCSTDPSANALDGARAAGAQSLALCAPDTGNDTGCPSARRVVHVRARTKLGYWAFRTRASNRGASACEFGARKGVPHSVGHAVGHRIL